MDLKLQRRRQLHARRFQRRSMYLLFHFARLSYMTDDDDQKLLFASHVPVTHLYLGDVPSQATISRISEQCPRLIELVIAAYGSGPIDRFLISMAKSCTQLSAVGLGDCEVTYVLIHHDACLKNALVLKKKKRGSSLRDNDNTSLRPVVQLFRAGEIRRTLRASSARAIRRGNVADRRR